MKSIKQFYFVIVMAMLSIAFILSPQTTQAHHVIESKAPPAHEEYAKITIKIIIIIGKKKKGFAEVLGMRPAGKSSSLSSNQLLVEAFVRENKMFIKPLKGEAMKSQLIIPKSFTVSKELGLKLGQKGGFTLGRGQIDLGSTKLGNFEIQD